MKTIQEKYNAVLEGKFPKSQFVKDAKRELSQFLSPYNGFNDSVDILKGKGILTEAKHEEKTKEYDSPTPKYSDETLRRGIDYELDMAGIDSAGTVSMEDREKAEAKAIKNIEIVEALELPPIKIHCSVLAEDSIRQAIEDYESKQ